MLGRALQLSRVLVLEAPTDSASKVYLEHWSGASFMLKAAGRSAGVQKLDVKSQGAEVYSAFCGRPLLLSSRSHTHTLSHLSLSLSAHALCLFPAGP